MFVLSSPRCRSFFARKILALLLVPGLACYQGGDGEQNDDDSPSAEDDDEKSDTADTGNDDDTSDSDDTDDDDTDDDDTDSNSDDMSDTGGLSCADGASGDLKRPYPQCATREGILPDHRSRGQLNQKVADFYSGWRDRYLKQSNGTTPGGGYYVEMMGNGPGGWSSKTTSEAHGYGMIIMALMAGFDDDAQEYFDGMYNMFDKHRSTANDSNMSWVISESESNADDQSSATDGDVDIAYALLLADAQWGSSGAINYKSAALSMIEHGIQASDMGSQGRPSLGDWHNDPWVTRPSDWMPGHFRVFGEATGNTSYWNWIVDTVYSVTQSMQDRHAPNTGLLPDFVLGETPYPAEENFLDEGTVDFSWNACRVPLRLAVDYGHFGDSRSREALIHMADWIDEKTGSDPKRIVAGYFLDGQPQVEYSSSAFTGPLVAAATVESKHQNFVNEGFDLLADEYINYYGDSIALLSLLYLSGNWWSP